MDCYWLPKEAPEELEEFDEVVVPELETLLQREQNRLIQSLQNKSLTPISKDIEALFLRLQDQPLLLKVALQECLQYHRNHTFEYEQEVVRIEGKEDKKKQPWRSNKRKPRRR